MARDRENPRKCFAIKMMGGDSKKYAEIECHIYRLVEKQRFTSGFIKVSILPPQYYEYGEHMQYKYIVMELIGEDLEVLKEKSEGKKLSVKTSLMVGLQAVDRLEALHQIGFVHRDVKPDNMAVGLREQEKLVYLFDFGLAKKIGSEMPKEEKGRVIGTIGFMSCRCHEGIDQGPADDIESLVYTLLYLMEGTLPWLKLQIRHQSDIGKVNAMKKSLSHSMFLNAKIPPELFEILKEIRSNRKVDYLRVKYLLLESLKRIKEQNDFLFDWCNRSRSKSKREKKADSPLKRKNNQPVDEKEIDSPRKKEKVERMKEENQQIVEEEIYNVYNFLNQERPKQ